MDREECFYRLYLHAQKFGSEYSEIIGACHEIEEMSDMYNVVKRSKAELGYELIRKIGSLGIDMYGFMLDNIDFKLGLNWRFCVKPDGRRFTRVNTRDGASICGTYSNEKAIVIRDDITILTTSGGVKVILTTSMKQDDEHVD